MMVAGGGAIGAVAGATTMKRKVAADGEVGGAARLTRRRRKTRGLPGVIAGIVLAMRLKITAVATSVQGEEPQQAAIKCELPVAPLPRPRAHARSPR